MQVKLFGEVYNVTPRRSFYIDNNSLAVYLIDTDSYESFATITVNVIDTLPKDVQAVDTNNCPWAEEFLVKYNLAKPWLDNNGDKQYVFSGYCVYPLYKFNVDIIREEV
jgi:hypothetical protein